jgi:EF-hand domain pair
MMFALGAAASALDAIQSLTAPKPASPPATGFDTASTDPFAVAPPTSGSPASTAGASGVSQLSPATMSALLAAQGQASATTTPAPTSRSAALQDLFSQIDGNGDGELSKSEFESALGAGGTNIAQADDVFSKMDKNGDGSVSLDEMSSALKGSGSKGGHHHHMHVGGSGGSGSGASTSADGASDPLLQALAGAASSSVTNSDGSTTTSITNPDGSKITMTSAAAKTSSSTATASYNFLEQMIQRAAQAISSGASQSLSMSV